MEFHPSMWPAEYVCPISRSVMADPVIVSSGHTYERICIETWLDLGQTICVKQNTPLSRDFIIPNIALRDAIANFAISKGMHALPSPPSPSLARVLAKHLISELHVSNHSVQASDIGEMDSKCISKQEDSHRIIDQVDADREESIFNPDEQDVRKEEMEGEDMIHRFGTMGFRDGQKWEFQKSSSSSHSMGYQQRNTATRGHMDSRHIQSDDVEGFKLSREQRGGSHDGYNRYTTADRYLVHRQPDKFRVFSEQGGGSHDTHREIQGEVDLTHRQSDNDRGLRVSREQREAPYDGYNRYTTTAREDMDLANREFDNAGGFRALREQREGLHDGYNRYTTETGDTNRTHRRSKNIEGLRVSNEEKGSSHDGCYTAANQEDTDLVHGHNNEGFSVSGEQRGSSHDGHSRYPRDDGLRDDYGKYSREDGYLTSPIPSRYSHSASGEALLKTSYGRGELPPNLVTKPSSYSTEAPTPLVASLSLSYSTTSLVEKLQDPLLEVQEAAVIELRQRTRMSAENRVSLCCPDLIHALLPHLKSDSSVVQINGVAALVNLSLEKQNKVMIVRSGAVPYLVEILKRGFPEAQEHAAGAIFSLALADENKDPIGVLNAIPPLVRLLHSGPPGSRQDAAMALYQLSLFQTNRSKLVKVGAVPILLDLAESKDRPDLASRVLLIVCNVAAIPEGRATLLEHDAITTLVNLLAVRSNKHIPEQAAAALLLLSKGNRRFKTMALGVGAQELLTVLADVGTARAREKALALLAIMKESSSGTDDLETEEMLSRQYLRRNKGRVDGVHMNSSAF